MRDTGSGEGHLLLKAVSMLHVPFMFWKPQDCY